MTKQPDYLTKRVVCTTPGNYPTGQHTFDIEDDRAESRQVIRQLIAFVRERLDVL